MLRNLENGKQKKISEILRNVLDIKTSERQNCLDELDIMFNNYPRRHEEHTKVFTCFDIFLNECVFLWLKNCYFIAFLRETFVVFRG